MGRVVSGCDHKIVKSSRHVDLVMTVHLSKYGVKGGMHDSMSRLDRRTNVELARLYMPFISRIILEIHKRPTILLPGCGDGNKRHVDRAWPIKPWSGLLHFVGVWGVPYTRAGQEKFSFAGQHH